MRGDDTGAVLRFVCLLRVRRGGDRVGVVADPVRLDLVPRLVHATR